MKQDGVEPVSTTHGFKFEAPGGKLRVADIISVFDSTRIKILLLPALTTKIDDLEMFMKGIDYSYYYE